ncbi:MAG TPA: flagellar motor protein MotB [Acidobacteriota bacterium]|nr:flagellar motor protein MotB [Acidobacteriota bacterium]
MGSENGRPILIVKKRGGHGEHHGGAWKVALADFMTAMMAFFLVMWIMAQSKEIKEGVGGYFRDPVGFSEKIGMGIMNGTPSALTFSRPGSNLTEVERRTQEQVVRTRLKETGREIVDALLALPGLSDMGDQIEVDLVDEGLRIRLMESDDSTFFALSSADLGPRGMEVFSTIGRILGTLDYDVILEGHTDSRQFPDRRYTNWELSSDRANTARRVLEASGLEPERILMVRAYGDRRLRYADRPDDPANRRVAILVPNRFSSENLIDMSERYFLVGRDTL